MTVAIYNKETIETDSKVKSQVKQQQQSSPPFFYPEASLDDVKKKALYEATEAKNNPYTFKRSIKRVAIIGAGPSGVRYITLFLSIYGLINQDFTVFVFTKYMVRMYTEILYLYIVTYSKSFKGTWVRS